VPVGVEKVLFTAALEPEFRARLLQDRGSAAIDRGFQLRPSEIEMLRLVPAAQLEAAIDRLDTSGANLERRGFMRAVAASALTLAPPTPSAAAATDTP